MPSMEYSLSKAFEAADAGPVLRAQLFPLANKGAIRVAYNGNNSSHQLYCDPSDTSPFEWVIHKSRDGSSVRLSAAVPYQGETPYVYVALDRHHPSKPGYIVTGPPPFEFGSLPSDTTELMMNELGFHVINLQARGTPGNYLTVSDERDWRWLDGAFPIMCIPGTPSNSINIFLGVTQHLQPGLGIPLVRELDLLHIAESLAAQSVSEAESMAQMIRASVEP